MPVIHIPTLIYDAISMHAETSYPYEACGLFSGIYSQSDPIVITGYTKSANLAPNPRTAFIIDPVTHIQLQKNTRATNETIIGIYHSHPDTAAIPSLHDRENAAHGNFLWIIASVFPQKIMDIRCYVTSREGSGFLEAPLEIIT